MRRRTGFTLIELLIVVLIIGILMGVAVPQWMKARETARRGTCLANLRQIEYSKEQYAMEMRKTTGDPVVVDDIFPAYMKGGAFPSCPEGGVYALGVVGQLPSCGIHGTN